MRAPLLLALTAVLGCGDKGSSDDTGAAEADTSADTGPDGASGEPCAAPFGFSDPGAPDYLQWAIDGVEYTSLPPAGGAYFFNSYLSVALYASDYSGSLGFGAGAALPDGLAAGTYDCAADGMFVNGGAAGMASAQAPGSSCEITLTADVADGGLITGTLWAQLVDAWGTPTKCVEARFSLKDAPP